jgi:ABC-type sugar transport system permease subunit
LMIFPTVFGWYLSFNEVFLSTFNKPVFNGIKNYINVLSDRMFAKSLIFTFKFTINDFSRINNRTRFGYIV